MTTKTLSTYVAAGYTLASQYDTLDITATGGVGGSGLLLNHLATLANLGKITGQTGGANGVHATAGGAIVNGSTSGATASIQGYSGVFAQNAQVAVANYGTILGVGAFGDGVFLTAGGSVANGSAADVGADIEGQNSGIAASGAFTTVTNFGSIAAVSSNGVDWPPAERSPTDRSTTRRRGSAPIAAGRSTSAGRSSGPPARSSTSA